MWKWEKDGEGWSMGTELQLVRSTMFWCAFAQQKDLQITIQYSIFQKTRRNDFESFYHKEMINV
jgi:hypothetical protein